MSKIYYLKSIIITLLIMLGIQFNVYSQDYRVNMQTDTTWKYIGRPRPGMTPLRFPPDSLLATNSLMWHGTPRFTNDLTEMFWSRYDNAAGRGKLVFIKYANNSWSSVQYAPFGNQNNFESCPFYSFSGDTLFFSSGNPSISIYRTCRTPSGWSVPEILSLPVPSGYSVSYEFSIARNGTIYTSLLNSSLNIKPHLYKSRLINGQYQAFEYLGNTINSDSSESSPYIDPEERFIIFASNRQGGFGLNDLYISKRKTDSTWYNPINLGTTINSSFEDVFPSITPDNLYFFFTTAKYGDMGYNPYWISTQYIYNLLSVGINEASARPFNFQLNQNYPNPFNPVTAVTFDVAKTGLTSLKVYNILGEEVATLVNENLKAGTYRLNFNGTNLSSGVYFYKLVSGDFTDVKKMMILK